MSMQTVERSDGMWRIVIFAGAAALIAASYFLWPQPEPPAPEPILSGDALSTAGVLRLLDESIREFPDNRKLLGSKLQLAVAMAYAPAGEFAQL